jgi:hypothetical protein
MSRQVASFVIVGTQIERSSLEEDTQHIDLQRKLEGRIGAVDPAEMIAGIVLRQGDHHAVEFYPPPKRADEQRVSDLVERSFAELDLAGCLPSHWEFK